MSDYSRCTELRNVQPNDLYRLAVILDENDYWRKLMEIIPKELNNQLFGDTADINKIFSILSTSERKYERDMIRLVEREFKRSGESRLCSQILFDEWGSSGRKLERPTLGVLLHLLLYAQLFRAADFVAESLLKESKPSRPLDGPGAEITCDLPSSFFEDIDKMANESENYPDTLMLQINIECASNLMNNNKDYYTKYREHLVKDCAPPSWCEDQIKGPPIPPPRVHKTARLKSKQLKTQILEPIQPIISDASEHLISTKEKDLLQKALFVEESAPTTENNIPKISLLMNGTIRSTNEISMDNSIAFGDSLPKLSFLRDNSDQIVESTEDVYSSNIVPNIVHTNIINTDNTCHDINDDSNTNRNLPAISALNLNGERDKSSLNSLSSCENVPSVAVNFNTTDNENSNAKFALNIPVVIANLSAEKDIAHLNQSGLEINVNNNNNNIYSNSDDADDVPNLSIFNDSSSINGGTSFEKILTEARKNSSDWVSNVF